MYYKNLWKKIGVKGRFFQSAIEVMASQVLLIVVGLVMIKFAKRIYFVGLNFFKFRPAAYLEGPLLKIFGLALLTLTIFPLLMVAYKNYTEVLFPALFDESVNIFEEEDDNN